MNYYRLHIGDYLRDTAHLSLLEHGVYTRLLQVYYTREQSISDAEKYRLVGARAPEEREAVDAVLAEFFVASDGAWTQPRCEREIAEYQAKAERNREVGRLGGRPSAAKNPAETQMVSTENPDVTLASSQEPVASKKQEQREAPVAADAAPSPRGCRIPDGFPGIDDHLWCRTERPDLDPGVTGEKFRDYWAGVPGAKGRKLDWPATWRNFVRSERAPQQARASPWQAAAEARDAKRNAFLHDLTGGLMGAAPTDERTIDVESAPPARLADPRR